MKNQLDYIISKTIAKLLSEAPARETNNANSDAVDSPFTPAEEMFLGKFDARGTNHLGIMYSITDIGKAEFISRSGGDLNLTPEILDNLIHNGIIKIVPYGGFGHNDNYTLELQLSLDDIKGLGDEERKEIESGGSTDGASPMPSEPTPTPEPLAPEPTPPNESFTRNKPLITEQIFKPDVQIKFLQYGFDFWDTVYNAMDQFDWDEDVLKTTIASIPTKNHAVYIDVAGLILLHLANTKFTSISFVKYLQKNFPNMFSITVSGDLKKRFHKLADLFDYNKVESWYTNDALDWSENIVNGRIPEFDKLRTRGIGVVKYQMYGDSLQPKALYTSYTPADVLNVYNQIRKPYGSANATTSDMLSNDEKIARAKAVWNTIVKNNLSPDWPKDKKVPDMRDLTVFSKGKVTAWVNSKGTPYVQVTNVNGEPKIMQFYSNGTVHDKTQKTWKKFKFNLNDTGATRIELSKI